MKIARCLPVHPFALAFLLPGIALLAIAALLFHQTLGFLAQASTVRGEVVAVQVQHRRHGPDMRRAVFRFETAAGDTVVFADNTRSSSHSYRRGDAVLVHYRPDAPDQARVDSFFSLWGAGTILSVLGVALSAPGALMAWWLHRDWAAWRRAALRSPAVAQARLRRRSNRRRPPDGKEHP
ncbi:MAG: DUF3592 domain-containing protein [Xenophilus sp.]